ncbi:serpin A3-8-like [Sorex fumeus]|uniref:serpin A3-8-like n=1 Tax=Sorex fumeus TaxID=62283 RepID=UPI0024ACAF89|nr:serpin A3-8-like [Sorex fumeus]
MSVRLALLLGAVLSLHAFFSISDSTELRVKSLRKKRSRPLDTFSLVRSNADFAVRLFKLLGNQYPGTNIIFSPFSVTMALDFLARGAHGPTRTEILQGLKFNVTKTPEADIHWVFQKLLTNLSNPGMPLQLDVNMAILLDQKVNLKENFKKEAQLLHSADIVSTNFHDPAAAGKRISDYVKEKTHGKIKPVVKDLKTDTKMVLVDSFLFKAKWETPFPSGFDFTSTFFWIPGIWVNVPGMRIENKLTLYFWDNKHYINVVKLPYMDGRASMLLILPNVGRMPILEAELNAEMIYFWRKSVKPRRMTLCVPKLSISRSYNLEKLLPMLGITKIFSQKADFSGLTTDRNLRLSQVIHEVAFNMAENGTEEDIFRPQSKFIMLDAYYSLNFCRPFMLAIISEETHNILFLGKVLNPKQA